MIHEKAMTDAPFYGKPWLVSSFFKFPEGGFMNRKKPTYEELERKLAEDEERIARLRGDSGDILLLDALELQEAYIESEQNFRNSLDVCPLGIRIITEDGELLYSNQAMLDICGY